MPRVTIHRLLTAAAVLALSGCGGASAPQATAADWTEALCTALSPLAQQGATLQSELGTRTARLSSDPGGVRDDLAEVLGAVATTFRAGHDAAQKSGAPRVDDGAKLQQDVLESLDGAATVFAEATKDLRATAAEPKAVADALTAAGTEISNGFSRFGEAFDALDDNVELSKAGKAEAACKELNTD